MLAALGGLLWAQQGIMFKALTKLEHPINEKIKHLLLKSSKNKLKSPSWENMHYDGFPDTTLWFIFHLKL